MLKCPLQLSTAILAGSRKCKFDSDRSFCPTHLLVHGNPGVARIHDFGDGLEIEHRVVLDHEHVVDLRHDVSDRLLGEFEGSGNDVDFVGHEADVLDEAVMRSRHLEMIVVSFYFKNPRQKNLLCELEEFPQAVSIVDVTDLLSQEAVEDQTDGEGQRESKHHEEPGEPYRPCAHCQSVPVFVYSVRLSLVLLFETLRA